MPVFLLRGRSMPISPIPRSLLPHTASLKKVTGLDARGKPTYAEDVTLSYVRFETARKNALTALGEQRNDLGLLFFDVQNSHPAETVFSVNDQIEFGERTFTIREVTPEYTVYGKPHHYEVALV